MKKKRVNIKRVANGISKHFVRRSMWSPRWRSNQTATISEEEDKAEILSNSFYDRNAHIIFAFRVKKKKCPTVLVFQSGWPVNPNGTHNELPFGTQLLFMDEFSSPYFHRSAVYLFKIIISCFVNGLRSRIWRSSSQWYKNHIGKNNMNLIVMSKWRYIYK